MAEERKLLWKYNSEFSYRCLIFYRCPASSAPIALQTWCQICWHYQVSLVQRTHTLSQLSLTSSYSEEENWIHRWSCMQGNQYRPTKCCTRLVPTGVGPQNVGQISVQCSWTPNLSNFIMTTFTQYLGAKFRAFVLIFILSLIFIFFS